MYVHNDVLTSVDDVFMSLDTSGTGAREKVAVRRDRRLMENMVRTRWKERRARIVLVGIRRTGRSWRGEEGKQRARGVVVVERLDAWAASGPGEGGTSGAAFEKSPSSRAG